ncbi:MAG: DUF4743 domain-containing protein [Alphaproteobacteria bacterium]|jgi:hypothetical protein|nr:DUF4743 domain-containing protein [Alphaproteobacteria bacterium]
MSAMSYLDHIRHCNNVEPAAFHPLRLGAMRVGWVHHDFAAELAPYGEAFRVGADQVELAPGVVDFKPRSDVVAEALASLAASGLIEGWRDEPYPVTPERTIPPLMQVERAACPYLGIRSWGVHLNGYVRQGDGPDRIHMWVARRAGGKATYPGMLDNMVAGGQPIGVGLMENLVKECAEEAAIPEDIARRASPVGMISYRHQMDQTLKPDQQFCFDLELPTDFTPEPADGEVEEFMLWPIGQVADMVRETSRFKFNCNLVIIDFLLRHGVIGPDHEPDYAAISEGLRNST